MRENLAARHEPRISLSLHPGYARYPYSHCQTAQPWMPHLRGITFQYRF